MSGFTARRAHRVRVGAVALLGLAASVLAPLSAANAGTPPAIPASLAADNPNGSTTVLTWEHVPGATRYDVQIDDSQAGFSGAPDVSVSTVSNAYVPTMNLKAGTQYWRVQAYNAAGESSGWADATFTKAPVQVPVLVSPAEGAPLQQPGNPPVLTWDPSPGAISYLVEVDGDSDFVGSTTYETKSTSLVVPDPLGAGDWFWRVVAAKDNNLKSEPSASRSFVISAIKSPVITSPPDDADFELTDVVLDWAPVPGAVSYEVEVATNTDFSQGSLIERRTGVRGTRYSPPTTFDNNQYYWRVRAIDTAGLPTPWTEARYNFNRTWPQKPTPVYPASAGTEQVPAPLYFQWTPVAHASEYEFQIGTQENFSVGTFASCRVAGTTYTPNMFAINTTGIPSEFRENEDCWPVTGEINYWRVRALDRPFSKGGDIPGVQGIFSQTQDFIYTPDSITNMTPRGGTTVDVPTLSWTPGVGAQTYNVTIRRNDGAIVDQATTYATSYTPKGSTVLDPAFNPYTWSISSKSTKGSGSLIYTNSFRVSGNLPTYEQPALTPLTPTPTTGDVTNAPSLTWVPMPGAAYYRVSIGNAMESNQVWFSNEYNNLIDAPVPYPAMTEISARLQLAQSYDWQVTAFDKDGKKLSTGPESRFTVQPIATITGHSVALGGQQLDDNYPGPKNPCTQSTGGCSVPATPVLKWNADPRVAFYMVYVSEDASFTNLLEPSNAIPATTNSLYAPALDNDDWTYGDNQAGRAYYWAIRPCRAPLNCGPDPVSATDRSQGTFIKRSPAVTGLTSSDPAGNEITFTWDDYFDTNQGYEWPQTGELSYQSAKQYRIEVFFEGNVIDRQVVDQPTYTAFDKLYPEGTLEWRVQAIDSDDNGLTWSTTKQLVKRSPQVALSSPVDNTTVAGTAPFRWSPQAFASSYDIEINRNDDTTFAAGTRVVAGNGVRTSAFSPPTPLPASSSAYVWRVRRTDASGNKGPWSAPGRFFVGSGNVTVLAPTAGSSVSPNGPLLQWQPVDGAASYSITGAPTSGSGAQFNASTVATAFAPAAYLTMGGYQWTVVARDGNGSEIARASSTFTVDSQIRAVQAPQIESPAGTGVGKTLTSRAVTWNMSGVDTSYQWLRDGNPIFTATGTSYTLTTDDFGKVITLRATGRKAGYLDGVSTSLPVSTTSGDAVNNITPPTISGNPTVGSYLTGNPGTWSGGWSTTTSMVWLRDGVVVPGATSGLYQVTAADGGRAISIRVTAKQTGYSDGVMDSQPTVIQTLQATVPVTVSAPNGAGVGGTILAAAPTWNQAPVDTTYQWLRDGQTLWGATGPSYTIGSDDVGKTISVRATGRKAGFPDGTSVSNGILAARGSAPQVVTSPSVKGTPAVGSMLTAEPGAWTLSPTFTYVWLRNGVPISGATQNTYWVTGSDAASQLSVQVTASAAGRDQGQAVTAPVAIGKLKSTTSLAVTPYSVTRKIRAKLVITVSAPGQPAPTGRLVIKDGKKTLKKLTLSASKKGVITFKMPKLAARKHKLKVRYFGSSTVTGSKAKLILTVGR